MQSAGVHRLQLISEEKYDVLVVIYTGSKLERMKCISRILPMWIPVIAA
jgi:hypothetical protein